MAKMLKRVVSGVFCLLFFGAILFGGADVRAQESEKPKDLGNWWLRSPFSYDPMPSQFLYHFEASYDWTRKTGNYTTDNHIANAMIVARKKRFTNKLNYTFDKRNTAKIESYPNDSDNVNLREDTRHEVHDDFRIALAKKLYLAPGFIWLRDELSMIQDRYTYYIGAGGTPLETEKFVVNLFCAYGHEELDYTDAYDEGADYAMHPDKYGDPVTPPKTAEEIDYEEGTRKYEVAYLSQSFDWMINEYVSFKEWFDIFQNTDDSDKYRWALDLSFDIAMTEHISFSPNYHEEYNNEPGLGVRPRDISIGAAVKISF